MAVFNVTDPSGTKYRVTAPDDATPEQLQSYVQQNIAPKEAPKGPVSHAQPEDPSIGDLASAVINSSADDWKGVGKDLVRYGASAGQGLFGLADEAGAGIGAGLEKLGILDPASGDPNASAYDRRLANIRQVQQEFQQEHPGPAAVGQLSTGLIATAPLMSAKALQAAEAVPGVGTVASKIAGISNPVLRASAQGAATGAPLGAVTGFGSAEGGFANRAEEGAKDAAIYGATAAAIPPALNVAGKTIGLAAKGAKAAGGLAARTLEDWYAPEQAAARQVGKALAADATPINGIVPKSLDDVIAGVKNGLTPAEAGGSNMEALMDATAQKPGPARPYIQNMMDQKVAAQAEAIPQAIQQALGTDGSGANAIELANASKAKLKPLAEAAFQPADDITSAVGADPVVQRLLGNKDVQAGIPRGIRIIRNEADAAGTPFNIHDYGLVETNPGVEDTMAIGTVPNMRLLDAAKRGLDAQINENSNQFGHLNDLGRTQYLLKKALVERMKALNPAYADYLNTAATEYSLQDAAKLGRGIWHTANKAETISQLADLSQPEKQMALEGAVRGLIEQIERKPDTANLAVTKLNTPFYRDLLSPLVEDPQALDGLVGQLQEKAQAFARNRNWLQQSRTALRLEYGKAAPGSIKSWIGDKLFNSPEVRDRTAQIMLNSDPNDAAEMLRKAYSMASKTPPRNFATNPAASTNRLLNEENARQALLRGFYAGTQTNNGDNNGNR
jgi:hypothetical protein